MSEAKQQLHPGTRNVMNDIVDKLHRVIAEKKAFQDHAVEVLAEALCQSDYYYENHYFHFKWGDEIEESKNRFRAEAREMLGIKEGENGRI